MLELTLKCKIIHWYDGLIRERIVCLEVGVSPVVLRPISSAKEYLSRSEVAPNFQTNTGETNVMKAADTNLERRILRKFKCI